MKLTFTIDGQEALRKQVERFSERRIAATLATALTRTAVEIKEGVRAELPRVFDRPTNYTLNSLFVKPARADRLQAEAYFKDDSAGSGTPATKYLLPQVTGGARSVKRFEKALQLAGQMPTGWYVVPGAGARLDAYGNISKGQIIQVLSQLRITLTAGFTRNLPQVRGNERKVANAVKRAGGRFFVIKPGERKGQPGVYQREFYGRTVSPVFIFVRSVSYRPRLDFNGIARRIADERLPLQIQRAIAEQITRQGGQP